MRKCLEIENRGLKLEEAGTYNNEMFANILISTGPKSDEIS